MRLFSCKVRLAGSLLNEVRKSGVTAAEITVLRVLHNPPGGEDAVLELKPTGQTAYTEDEDGSKHPRNDKEERARLEYRYNTALETVRNVGSLNGVFPPGVPLPKTVDGIEGEISAEEPIRRTKVA